MIHECAKREQGVRNSDPSQRRFTMQERSPAQVYALVIGLTLVIAGIVGFFYSASFSTGDGTASRQATARRATPSSGSSM